MVACDLMARLDGAGPRTSGAGRSEVKEEARPQAGPGDMSGARHPAASAFAPIQARERPQWADGGNGRQAAPPHFNGMNAVPSTSMRTCREGSMPLTSTTVDTGGSPG